MTKPGQGYGPPSRKKESGSIVKVTTDLRDFSVIGNNSVVKGQIYLGKDVVIGSMVLIEGENIVIGSRTKFMPFCAIGSNTHIGRDCFFGPFFCHANAREPGPDAVLEQMTIGNDCIFGARVMVEPGIIIGNNVKVAMGAYIDTNIPDNYYVPRLGSPRPRNDIWL